MAQREDGSYLIVMGISEGNAERLRQGDPIYFSPAALRIPSGAAISGITLFYGKDDQELSRIMMTLIGPETTVIVSPRGDTRPQ